MIIDIKFYFSKIIKLVHNASYYLLKLDNPAAFKQMKNKLQCKEIIFSLLIIYNNNILILYLFATHNKMYLEPTLDEFIYKINLNILFLYEIFLNLYFSTQFQIEV